MEIAVISPVPASAGGMGRVADAHARLLRERGHSVTMFAPGTTRAIRIGNAAFMPDAIRRARAFDVVLLEYPCFGTAELIALRRSRNLLVYYHMDVVGRGLWRFVFDLYRRMLLPMILKRARQVFVSSMDYAQSSYLAALPCSRALKHEGVMREVPLGVDTTRFFFETTQSDSRTVLFVGGLDRAHYFKGLVVLLRAISSVPKAKLVVVGDGDSRSWYEMCARRFGLTGRVEFLGWVADDALPTVYRQADILVLPSLDRSEAFGMVLLEAQASGVPVIASDLPGVRTALIPGKTGILVPPNDPTQLMFEISWLLNDPVRRALMGRAARAFAEARDWRVICSKLEQALL